MWALGFLVVWQNSIKVICLNLMWSDWKIDMGK